MTNPIDAVVEKHAASKTPAVLLADQRHYADTHQTYFSVDVLEYEALGLSDTRAVFFNDYESAQAFAGRLAHLLGLSVEYVL